MGSHQEEIKFYKKFAKEYDKRGDSYFAKTYYNYWDRLLLDTAPQTKDFAVLDLGCGTGEFLAKLSKRYKKAIGLDISPEMLRIAKKKYPYLAKNLLRGVAEHLPFDENSFDIVFIRGSLHHFQNPLTSLKEIHRVLKKRGLVVFLEPCSDFFMLCFLRKIIFKIRPQKFLAQHRSFTKKEIEEMLNISGFRIKSWTRLGLLAYPLCARFDLFPVFSYLPFKKFIASFLIKLDELLIKFFLQDRLSLLIIFRAQKNS